MNTPPLLSTTLQAAAASIESADFPLAAAGLLIDTDALVDALEHAAALAAEHEYTESHSVVQSDFAGDWTTAYPPLVRLLAKAIGGDA